MNHQERKRIREQALQDIKNGELILEVARKYRRTPRWVYAIMKENKIEPKGKFKTFEMLRELFNKEKNMEEIGKQFGCTKQRVSDIYCLAKEIGIPGLPERKRGRQ